MRLLTYKTRSLVFSFLTIVGCFGTSISAENGTPASGNSRPEQSSISGSARKNNVFGFGGAIGYVAPYVWKGIPLTSGPCIQPEFWVSVKGFKLGAFINLFGSNKDRGWIKGQNPTIINLDSGECSQSFGMINQVNFFLTWTHSFTKSFSLLTGYTQYAYGEYMEGKPRYEENYGWFHKNVRYGEFTIKPCFKIGIFNLFTEQNFVLIAPDRSFQYEDTSAQWVTLKDSRFGSYHGVFGINIQKEFSDELACILTIQEEIANRNFFKTLYRNPLNGETVIIEGAYQRNIRLSSRYSPWPWFAFYANCGAEFITKETLSNKTEKKGAFLFGGVSTTFSFSL